MKKLDKNNMSVKIIVLSLIFIFPLGVYFLVKRAENRLHNLCKDAKYLIFCGYLVLFSVIIYFLCNYSFYISLADSHMSFDMYNFNFIYIYIYLIMVTISCLVGGYYLYNKCRKLIIYTEFINIRHIKDINMIVDETEESVDTVKKNIVQLIEKKHLLNVKLVGENIVTTKKNNGDEILVRCKKCGNIEALIKDTECCDFCYNKLSRRDKI